MQSTIVNVSENKQNIEEHLKFLLKYANVPISQEIFDELFGKYKKFCHFVMYDVYAVGTGILTFDKRFVEDFRVTGMPNIPGDPVYYGDACTCFDKESCIIQSHKPLDELQISLYLSIANRSQGLLPIDIEFHECYDICGEDEMWERFNSLFRK